MKKIFLLGLIICQCLVFFSNVTFAETPITPKKVGVLELDNKTPYPHLGRLASTAIMVHLLKNKSCEIIDQDTLATAFTQRGVNPRGVIDPAIATSVGATLGLDYIIMGNLVSVKSYSTPGYWNQTKFGPQYVQGTSASSAQLEVMMVDIKTAKIVWMENVSGNAGTIEYSAAIEDGGYTSVRKMYKFIPLQGTIIRTEGEKYLIDLNKNNGIEKDDLFSPIMPTLETGEETKPSVILKIIEVGDTYCVAVLKKGKSTNIQAGTIVSRHFKTTHSVLWYRKSEDLNQNSK